MCEQFCNRCDMEIDECSEYTTPEDESLCFRCYNKYLEES